eukprot:14464698-Ditylum_brightwellii.AAC.2
MWTHLFKSQHDNSIAVRTLAITMFLSKPLKLKIAFIMKQVICYKIAQWCKLPIGPDPRLAEDEISNVIC